MFANIGASPTKFNQDISSWNVSSVINMSSMFWNTVSFNRDLSSWEVSNVIECSYFGSQYYTLPKPNFTSCNPD
jgi:surface protein